MHTEHVGLTEDDLLYLLDKLRVGFAAEDRRNGLPDALSAHDEDEQADEEAAVRVHVERGEPGQDHGQDDDQRNKDVGDAVHGHRFQGRRIEFFPVAPVVGEHVELQEHGAAEDKEADQTGRHRFRMDHLADGLLQDLHTDDHD